MSAPLALCFLALTSSGPSMQTVSFSSLLFQHSPPVHPTTLSPVASVNVRPRNLYIRRAHPWSCPTPFDTNLFCVIRVHSAQAFPFLGLPTPSRTVCARGDHACRGSTSCPSHRRCFCCARMPTSSTVPSRAPALDRLMTVPANGLDLDMAAATSPTRCPQL